MKLSLITSVKNEGPYILEWLAYHKALGFDYIIVFENDSDDLTDVLLQRLAQMGEIAFVKNRDFTGSPQFHSYRQFQKMDAYRRSDWVLCIDADEFFVPRLHNTAPAFLDTYPKADAIAVNWLNFGSGAQETWHDKPVTERFRNCAPATHPMNRFFKSFHRPCDKFQGFGIHRPWPHSPLDRYVYTDGSPVESEIQMGQQPSRSLAIENRHAVATINHYSIRSREEFERKKLRGDGAKPDTAYGENNKFKRMDTNTCTDRVIDRYEVNSRKIRKAYYSDPVLNFLHSESCMRHFNRSHLNLGP